MSNLKSLSEIQLLIQSTVKSKQIDIELSQIIVERPPISIQERIKIYQDAYHIRLLESLRSDFSGVEDKLGEKEFESVALDFIEHTPSKVRNLAEYSKSFPKFIKNQSPDAYLEAVTDWLEILSVNAEVTTNEANSDGVQQGKEFKIKTHPSTQAELLDGHHIVVHCFNDEVNFIELNQVLFNFLKFLTAERSLEEVGSYAQEAEIDNETLSKTIAEWIQNKVIYCKLID